MKYFLVMISLILTACAQLQHGAIQPVVMKSAKDAIFFTSCSGAVEVWGNCHDKAKITCEKGYKTLEIKDEANGGRRELTFQCKK
jgi:hypothetical protein